MRTHAELSAGPGIAAELSAAPTEIDETDRLPPLTAFGMTLLLCAISWGAVIEIVRFVRWLLA